MNTATKKCLLGYCNAAVAHPTVFCALDGRRWVDSAEWQRALNHPGPLGATAFGDFVRRVEAEHRNQGAGQP